MFLAIRTTYPQIQIKTELPRQEIRQEVSKVQIEKEGPRLRIDQSECLDELGLGSYQELSRQIRDRSYQKVLEALAQISGEGDEILAKAGLFQERMIFSEIDRRKTRESIPELNIGVVPQNRPRIAFDHEIKISWEEGGAHIKYYGRPPAISWELGQVEIWVEEPEERGG